MAEKNKQNNKAEKATEAEIPFMSHLVELRDRLLRAVLVILVIFLALFSFSNELYSLLAEPLLIHLPTGSSMIATEVASPFLTPFKLAMMSAIFISMPFLLYQLWAFIAPGLYKHEKSLAFPLLFSSIILFYLGMVFAYFVVFPLMFKFFTGIALEGVTMMTDITKYLDFVLKMFFAFGMAFEVPIATILVISTGMTTADKLAEKRPYIIVVAFIAGMLLTPPDVVSQMLLAVPMWILFELGLVFSRILTRRNVRLAKEREEQEEKELDDEFEQAIAEEEKLNKD
ncbi:MAG: twin-arginine translocase subunit TatC [Gammaproteobacteria bacterium]|nr:twin-arginine translocase subunit TatC [Gammaproteobacteria bacterium]